MINKLNQSILLDGGTIYDSYNNKKIKGSILIQNGLINKVGAINPSNKMQRVDCKGKIIAPGVGAKILACARRRLTLKLK